jgi:hypothetical protein
MVADLHHCNADPDTAFHFNADSDPSFQLNADTDPDPGLLLIKVMRTCDHYCSPQVHFEPLRLHCERPGTSTTPFLA